MRRLSGEKPVIGRIVRPSRHASRARRGAALAALCALTLAACGTERAGDEDAKAGSPAASRAGGGDADSGDAEFLAFMEMLTSLAKPCLKDVPDPEPPPEREPEPDTDTAAPPTTALPEPSLPDEPPPAGEPQDPESARKEVELSSVEKCDARIHTRRITKALKDTADPTPGQVGDVLRGLGYIDERIHGPQRSGESVEFTLDLRVMGGQLCLSGRVTGARTFVEPYGASEEVSCPDVRRRA